MNTTLHAGTMLLALVCTACNASPPPAAPVGAGAETPIAAAPETEATIPHATAAQTPPVEAATADKPAPETQPQASAPPESTAAPALKPRPAIGAKTPLRPAPPATAAGKADAAPVRITISALSRGKGVPSETRQAFKQIRALLERRQAASAVAAVRYQRIGIEGESRLCVEFRSAGDAQAVLTEIRTIAAGADLLDIVEAPCPSNKEWNP